MATAEEILAGMTAEETQQVLVIDSELRRITIPEGVRLLGVTSDDDVLRLRFTMPRVYGEVDLSGFAIRINYLNAGSEGDVYPVDDAQTDGDVIRFTWLVGRHACKFAGDVRFIVCLKRSEGGEVAQEYNTTLATLPVLEGLETGEAVAQAHPDVIEAILKRLDTLEQEGGSVSTEAIAAAVAAYLTEHPVEPGATAEQAAQIEANRQAIEELKQSGTGGITEETDPTVPAWAKQPNKPTYTAGEVGARPDTWTPSASEVGADAAGTAAAQVGAHNTSGAAHADLRALIEGLTNRLNALADSDDTTLDQLSEIVAYIKSNKALIDAVTTGKVSVSDIVDNLTTNASGKVLSAAQGVALKAMIDGIVIPTALPNPQPITINGQRYDGSEAVTVTVSSEGGGTPVEIDDTLTQSGKAADAKAVGDQLSALNEANATQDERLTTLEQAGGIVTVEPAQDDVPIVFFGGDLPQTKTDTVMPFKYVSKTKTVNGYAKAKAQGNSSMSYPKKNQTVNMYADEALVDSVKVDFKGWGVQKKHVYKANWIDLTHARNIVSAQLWGDVVKSRTNYADLPELLRTSPNQGAIDGFPVLVYANGVYQGRYTINIPKDAWMANMDKTLDNHCILCGENYVSGCFRATANIDGSDWSDEVHDTVPVAIKTRWNEIISFVMNATDDEFVAGIGNYFYLDSLIDYYIFGVVSCGLDAFGKNQLYQTYDGQKWIATMYDMDSTWGLWWNGSSFVATDYARTEFQDFKDGQGNLLYIRLEELFYEQIQSRWAELKDTVLSYSNIMTRFERFIGIVPPHIVKEDYASTTGGGKFTGIPSQTANHIQQLRAYVAARLPYADEWFASLTPVEEIPCTGITLDQTTLTFKAAGTQTLTATVTPSNTTDTVVWSSDAPSIASVNGGVVTAKANGSATITAMCGAYSATCAVSVSGIGGGSGDDLPGYTLVDNIASDGKAWIDTGVSGGTSSAYEIDFDPRWSANIEYEQYFAGTKTAPYTPKIYSAANHTKVEFTSGNTPSANVETPTTGWTRMLVSYQGGNSLTVDGVEHTLSGSHENLGWGSETWYVFNSHSESNLPASMVLYLLKMWKDGELVREFVPAKRNADNMIGLYDKVEDKFYTSIGSGNFYLYSEYTNRITYDNVQLTAGSAIASENGTVVTSNNGKYSPEYFEMPKEPVVGALCFAGVSGATWYSLAFYDSEKNYVSGSRGDIARNIIVPDDVAYVRVSVFNAKTDTLSLTVAK